LLGAGRRARFGIRLFAPGHISFQVPRIEALEVELKAGNTVMWGFAGSELSLNQEAETVLVHGWPRGDTGTA